ncbi:phage head-tail connector protein [Listeria kieliensis]
MTDTMLESVKRFKGITDTLQDDLLKDIIDESKQRILNYINQDGITELKELSSDLDYIVRDVSIKRFNRLDSEGASSDSEEGKSYSWESSYLDEYKQVLDKYRIKRGGKGIAVFL